MPHEIAPPSARRCLRPAPLRRSPPLSGVIGLAAVIACALVGCDSATTPDALSPDGGADAEMDATVEDMSAPCTAGTADCPCTAAGRCGLADDGTALVCVGAVCGPPGCMPGETGCACAEGACFAAADACVDDVCEPVDCALGQTGCPCTAGGACDDDEAVCEDGRCRATGCPAGQAGCSCAGGACLPGLICEGDVCVDNTGGPGGPCRPDATCDRGLLCQDDVCTPCALGSAGCACDPAGGCAGGLECLDDTCRTPGPPTGPDDALCYTPCQGDLVGGDGRFVRCPADGLMPGCHQPGRSCRSGSCLLDGEAPPACASSTECPEHQVCIGGMCYSDCVGDDDCAADQECHKHACRDACDIDDAQCPAGTACTALDGSEGICLPTLQATGDQRAVDGRVVVSTPLLGMTNQRPGAVFSIYNDSGRQRTFLVHKLDHTVNTADGGRDSRSHRDPAIPCDAQQDCPLNWLALGAEGDARVRGSIEITVPPGTWRAVEVANANGSYGVRWTGTLRIIEPDLNPVDVVLGYSQVPTGQWRGTMYFFTQWDTTGLEAWRQTPHSEVDDAGCLSIVCDPGDVCTDGACGPDPCAGVACADGERCDAGACRVPPCDGACADYERCVATPVGDRCAPAQDEILPVGSDTRDDPRGAERDRLGNAFLRTWTTFRRGGMGFREFQAVLLATRTGSWATPAVRAACVAAHDPASGCYLYDGGGAGVKEYTPDVGSKKIPSGMIDLPMVLNLRQSAADPARLDGRIVSNGALHYAGNPAVSLRFAHRPELCSRNFEGEGDSGGACLTFFDVEAMSASPLAVVNVGGRYEIAEGEDCAPGFEEVSVPWLPIGFERNTHPGVGELDGTPVRTECRSARLPFGDAAMRDFNIQLAGSNPIPDGRPRVRRLSIVDGAMINQQQLLIIFEENFESFLDESLDGDAAGFSSYGYMLLELDPTPLDIGDLDQDGTPDVYQGATPGAAPADSPDDTRLAVTCSPEMLDRLGVQHVADDPRAAVAKLIHGVDRDMAARLCRDAVLVDDPDGVEQPCLPDGETLHYLCVDGDTFDGGVDAEDCRPCIDGDVAACDDELFERCAPGECPPGSEVIFFTVGSRGPRPAEAACGAAGQPSCADVLQAWYETGRLAQYRPAWTCRSPDAVQCSADRFDLRRGKLFFPANEADAPFPPLSEQIAQAFRYKVRFRNRDGGAVGFAPEICRGQSNPYCYDPVAVEQVRARVDCLIELWSSWLQPLDRDALADLRADPSWGPAVDDLIVAMINDFSVMPWPEIDVRLVEPGTLQIETFERLYAELLIMLGDEAYTQAFGSRFDIAGARPGVFRGSAFETDGVDLSGVAGNELRLLYEAAQYYDEALGRFYSLAPTIWKAVELGEDDPRNFVKQQFVTEYLERLVRASTQKSKASSAIGERYAALDRPELAKRVIERQFTAAYLESVVFARFLTGIVDEESVSDAAEAQIAQTQEQAQQRYRSALLDMRAVFERIRDNLGRFGFAPGYVPIVTIDVRETNAFELAYNRAQTRARVAREREETAIGSNRAFESDTVAFQSELVRIRNTYDAQLGELCGTFVAGEVVYPATTRYVHLDPDLHALADPCGLLGNGDIFSAITHIETSRIDMQRVLTQLDNTLAEIEIERGALAGECGLAFRRADRIRVRGNIRVALNTGIRVARFTMNRIQSALHVTKEAVTASTCVAPDCAKAGVAFATYGSAVVAADIANSFLELGIATAETALEVMQNEDAAWEAGLQCDSARIHRNAQIDRLHLRLTELSLDALRAEYQLNLQIGEITRLRNRAARLRLEQQEAEQLATDAAAARNDPNIRIYRNDAVINADTAFDAAMREAYKATLVFEYYTSQSYARRGDLNLTRLVARGERNLEDYLLDLHDAFLAFEESFGLPNTRVMVLSLRDDILRIPRTDGDGRALGADERIARLRSMLANPALLDGAGYLSIPFETRFEALSPATRNHKIRYIEAELNVSDPGDSVARLYLVQDGTSAVHAIGGERLFFRLPRATAVINPYFSGAKSVFAPEVYLNQRLRDRPLVATDWRLIINQRDEVANQDVNLQSLNDIRLFVYYTDFTEF